MTTVRAVIHDRRIEVAAPEDLPDGTKVVLTIGTEIADDEGPMSPDELSCNLTEGGRSPMPPTMMLKSPEAGAPVTQDAIHSMVCEWNCGTAFVSSVSEIIGHPAFRRIVKSGSHAIPYILKELEKEPSYLVLALGEITGVNPVPAGSGGKLTEMTKSWLAWGEENEKLRSNLRTVSSNTPLDKCRTVGGRVSSAERN